eukprot:TRINITY_DN55389_c0_g1_i1.p1 TRINITY_DN55389_c0_g1~~TRINITY_DN55389_c0_g1_i1.p1  ORF type:complete len:465 (+),score=53.92 TRINITY_DN55389_c0_g1_i1:79-1473(+)
MSLTLETIARDTRPCVKQGADVLMRHPLAFPQSRRCKDIIWMVVFFASAVGVPVTGIICLPSDYRKPMAFYVVCLAISVSIVTSMALAILWIRLLRTCSFIIVWFSLLFIPNVLVVGSIVMMLKGQASTLAGVALMCVAFMMYCCILICFNRFIPFTASVLKEVATIISRYSGLIVVASVGVIAIIIWCVFCILTMSMVMRYEKSAQAKSFAFAHLYYFGVSVVFVWGSAIFQNVTHVTNCGVVGRALFGLPESVCRSLLVAVTTSFGSICFGSLIVAFIEVIEMMMKAVGRDTRDRNTVQKLILGVIEFMFACIRPIIVAFDYFAYVQVSLRGFSFLQSVKATYALCTVKNVYAITSYSLVGLVVALGSLLCGIGGGLMNMLVGHFAADRYHDQFILVTNLNMFNFLFGMVFGLLVATIVLRIIMSGFATVLVCWAEDETMLSRDSQLQTLERLFSDRSLCLF